MHGDSGCPHIPKELDDIVNRTEMALAKIACIQKLLYEQEDAKLRFKKSNHATENFKLHKNRQ